MTTLDLIIEPETLAEHLGDSNLLIVDLSSEASYRQGHVPGAVFLPFQALMAGTAPAPGKLPEPARLQQVLRAIGLTDKHHVVAYDDEGGGWAGRLIWTLDVIGHRQYSYLNGGIHAWRSAGLSLSDELTEPAASDIEITIDRSPIAEVQDILEQLERGDGIVWDARSGAEYRGEKVLAARGGHIPGAIHCDWLELMDREHDLRIRADAKAYLARLGIDSSKPIITHCQSHHRSALAYLVGKSLGFNIRGYHGSWSEWGNLPDTPIEV